MELVILDLCGGTGAWSQPYVDAGYDVWVRTLPADVRLMEFPGEVHGILAAPPCTVFANSGAWVKRTDEEMRQGLSVVDACLRLVLATRPRWWALENPVGKLRRYLGPPALIFQPHHYGDPYTKRTLLWGDFNELRKTPVEPVRVCEQGSWVQKLGGRSEKTKALRSMTPPGFARAFYEANP